MAMKIIQAECTSCGACEPECPTESITERKSIFKINVETCTQCEGESPTPQCVAVCPAGDDCIVVA